MFSWLANAWRVPELRRRVLFTAMILAVYRLGSWIPAPGVNSQTIEDYFSGRGDTILGLLNLFSGGALSQFSIFALGIMPYVTALRAPAGVRPPCRDFLRRAPSARPAGARSANGDCARPPARSA